MFLDPGVMGGLASGHVLASQSEGQHTILY
jgi:hypothetical protein